MFQILHLIAGAIFAVIDTDGFMPELNVFTLVRFVDNNTVIRAFRYLYLLYFFLASRKQVTPAAMHRWRILTMGIGVYFIASVARIAFDRFLFQSWVYTDPLNVALMGWIAVGLGNQPTIPSWLKNFGKGWLAGMGFRAVCHFAGVSRVVIPGMDVETRGFYGTFTIHALLLVVGAFCYAMVKLHQGQKLAAAKGGVLVMIFAAVIASSYRRWGMLMCFVEPSLALMVAYILLGQFLKRLPVILLTGVGIGALAWGILVINNGVANANDRLYSLINPSSQTSSLDSNLHYLDDQQSFIELISRKPFGVGYGNFYNVPRFIDAMMNDPFVQINTDADVPMHIGSWEILARMGVFGLMAIAAPIIALMTVARDSWRRFSYDSAFMLAFSFTAFGFTFLQPYSAPMTSEIKVFAIYGIILGLGLRVRRPVAATSVANLSDSRINRATALGLN